MEDRWGPGGGKTPANTGSASSQELGCGSKCHFYCSTVVVLGSGGKARKQQGACVGELMLGWGCPSLGRRKLGQTQAPRDTQASAPRPVLAGAQDGLQVLGQGPDDHLDVQLGLMQCLLLHGELVDLCPHLQGQWWSGAGNLHVLWPGLGRARSLTSFSRSFRTRSTTSTSDLSFIQVSMSCHEKTWSPII